MNLPKGFLKLNIIIIGALCILFFITFRLSHLKTETSILLSLGILIITLTWSILEETQGKKRHTLILESNGFKEL